MPSLQPPTSPIEADFDSALREASGSLGELRGLAEPYWLGVALITTGFSEMALGHHEVALAHIREARQLAERTENAWLSVISTFWAGTTRVTGGPTGRRAGIA